MFPDNCYDCMSRQMPMTQGGQMSQGIPGYIGQAAAPGNMPMYTGGQLGTGMQQGAPMPYGFQTTPTQMMAQTGMMPQAGMIPQTGAVGGPPVDFELGAGAPVTQGIAYTQGWLRTQIGRRVKIEFIIGTNMFIDREGTLLDVGVSYVVIRETDTDDILMCDIYSIKFVKVYF